MVDTIKFSQMTDGGNINNDDKVPGLLGNANVLFNNPWTFLPPGTTAERPAPSATINYRLRFNTDDQVYEYYNALLGVWTQLSESSVTQGPFLTYTADVSLPDAQNLGLLANGILKQTITLGVATLDIAVQGTDYYGFGDTPTFNGMTLTDNLDMGGFTAFNAANPVQPQDYATKFYVDQTALTGTSVYAASAATLGTVTQSGAGMGATLTNAGVQAVFALDGVNPPAGTNVLIKNIATGMSSANEGIYTVTSVGSVSTNWVLTRATSYNTPDEINNTGLIVVQNGSTLAGTAWYNASTIVTVDTTAFSYSQFGNIIFPVSLANGGTSASLVASNGGIFYSTASAGAILSGTATARQMLQSGATAAPAWSTATYPATTTINRLLYSSANNTIVDLATVNSAGLLTSAGGVPGWVAYTGTGAPVLGTSPTITTPNIVTSLRDVNGNTMLMFNPVASADNYFQFLNSVSGGANAIAFSAQGADTNLILSILGKGTGRAQIKGTGTNDLVTPGSVGEFSSSVIPAASAVSLSSTTAANVTSISLTAGDWDVWGNVFFTVGGTTSAMQGWISTTSATIPDQSLFCQFQGTAILSQGMCVPGIRVSIGATTTVYLSARGIFSTSTLLACGGIYARRRS